MATKKKAKKSVEQQILDDSLRMGKVEENDELKEALAKVVALTAERDEWKGRAADLELQLKTSAVVRSAQKTVAVQPDLVAAIQAHRLVSQRTGMRQHDAALYAALKT